MSAYDFSLTASTSTANSSSSFPVLSPSLADVLQEIVARTPPETTDFRALMKSYQQVLAEKGLNVKTDGEVYSLLLKLSLVKGKEWIEKWECVRREQGLGPTRKSPAVKPKGVENGDREYRFNWRRPARRDALSPTLSSSVLPRPAVRFQTTPSPPHSVTTSSLSVGSHLHDPSVACASKHRRRVLLRRQLHVWRAVAVRWGSAVESAVVARRHLTQGQVLGKWRALLNERRHKESVVQAVADRRRKAEYIRGWRSELQRERTKKWEHFAREVAKDLANRHRSLILRHVFQRWFNVFQALRFRNSWAIAVAHSALVHWHSRTLRLLALNDLAFAIQQTQLKQIVQAWHERAGLKRAERTWTRSRDTRKCKKMLSLWRTRATQKQWAASLLLRTTAIKAFRVWRSHYLRIRRIDRLGDKVHAFRSQNTLTTVLYQWLLRERGSLLQRVQLIRSNKRALVAWKRKKEYVVDELEGRERHFAAKLDAHLAKSVLLKWRDSQLQRAEQLQEANRISSHALLVSALVAWRTHRMELKARNNRASCARVVLLWGRAWAIWGRRLVRERVRRWIARRREEKLRLAWRKWVIEARRRKDHRQRLQSFRSGLDKRLAASMVRAWLCRVMQLKSRETQVEQKYFKSLPRRAWLVWRERLTRIRTLEVQASDIVAKRERDQTHDILEDWRGAGLRSRDRQSTLASFQGRQRVTIITSAWIAWRDAYLIQGLKDRREHFEAEAEHCMRVRTITRWLEISDSLHALRYFRHQLAVTTFRHWRLNVLVKRMRVDAEKMDCLKLIPEAWKVWRTKFVAKQASRISSRFSCPMLGHRRSIIRSRSPSPTQESACPIMTPPSPRLRSSPILTSAPVLRAHHHGLFPAATAVISRPVALGPLAPSRSLPSTPCPASAPPPANLDDESNGTAHDTTQESDDEGLDISVSGPFLFRAKGVPSRRPASITRLATGTHRQGSDVMARLRRALS